MKNLVILACITLAFTASKCTFNGPAAQAADLFGCSNVWSGDTLTKTGVCNLTYGGTSTKLVQTVTVDESGKSHIDQRKERE